MNKQDNYWNCNDISQLYCFKTFVFDQINTALVSINNFFQKYWKILNLYFGIESLS